MWPRQSVPRRLVQVRRKSILLHPMWASSVFRSLKSLTIACMHPWTLSFAGFAFPKLASLDLSAVHWPVLDGLASTWLQQFRLAAPQTCPRFGSQYLAASLAHNVDVQFAPAGDVTVKHTCAASDWCTAKRIELRFGGGVGGRSRWQVLLGALPFDAWVDWLRPTIVVVVCAGQMEERNGELIARVVAHLLSRQMHEMDVSVVVESEASNAWSNADMDAVEALRKRLMRVPVSGDCRQSRNSVEM